MAQINLHTTPEFEAELASVMKARGVRTKSEAIRLAVREAAGKHTAPTRPKYDLTPLVGMVERMGGDTRAKTAHEILEEIDREMDEKLERLGRQR